MSGAISSLCIFPIKSCAAVEISEGKVTRYGLEYDRRYAIVDLETNEIMTQRKLPQLALIQPEIIRNGATIRVHLPNVQSKSLEITCKCKAIICQKIGSVKIDMNGWLMGGICENMAAEGDAETVINTLSSFFGKEGKRFGLVMLDASNAIVRGYGHSARMNPGVRRLRHQLAMGGVASESDTCAFHDIAPLMITTTQSLEDLNRELQEAGSPPVQMDRMRGNIVIRGSASSPPWDEEFWGRATISSNSGGPPVSIRVLQSCVRCTVVTIDQKTGERPDGQNPTKQLRQRQTRTVDSHGPYAAFGPFFGTWAAADEGSEGRVIRVGDNFTVTARDATSSYRYWLPQPRSFAPPSRPRWLISAAAAAMALSALSNMCSTGTA
jgi:uncharacterized protein YcbX